MLRRRSVPLTIAALSLGTLLAAAGGSTAGAATASHHPGSTSVRPGGAVPGFQPGGALIGKQRAPSHGRFTTVTSTNWSGYAATGGNGAFTSVSASWTQPKATCTSRGNRYAAFWVGLDGYSSSSVEQTGSDSDCMGRTPTYYGWYEIYPANPVYYANTVRAGDSFTASVVFSGTSTYTLTLTDHTRRWTQRVVKRQSGLARSSAEVITEAPSSQFGVLPLAKFGTISYTASTDNGSSMGTQHPTAIVMVDGSGRDKDSTSSISGGGNFSNSWIRST